jgi:hypothetical protein
MIRKILFVLLLMCSSTFAQTTYNAIATAYVTTTISQDVVFNDTMRQGGTFTMSVLAHNGGGRAGQSDTANVRIQFYNFQGGLMGTFSSSYNANLPNPNAVCGNPCIDTSVPWSTLTVSTTVDAASAANIAYAKVSMYGIDGSYWAGDYGPWYRAPTFQLNGGGNLLYNPEFGPYNNITAQGWVSNPGFGACQGAWGGSNACIVNSDGVPGTSTVGLVANANGGGPSVTGGTTSGTPGGYNSTMSVTNAGTGATAGAAPAPTVTGTSVTYSTRNVVNGNTTLIYRTPVTTTTYSDGTSTSTNGTEALYQTKVSTAIITNKIVGNTLTTYSTPVYKVTPAAGGASTLEANGNQTVTTQTVQQGLNFEVWRYDPKNYACVFGLCAWNLTYHTPSTNRNDYGNPVNSGRTSSGIFVATNSDLPNNDNSLVGANDGTVMRYTGTITAPITTARPAGTVYRLYFYNNTDDGFVLRVNGGTIINQNETEKWQAVLGYTSNGWMDVVAGQTYNLEAWYWNTWGGFGNKFYWDYGDGVKSIYNTSFTTGNISNIDIDLTGLSYSDPNIVPVGGTPMSLLCCGGSAEPFNADSANSAKVMNFMNRTTQDSKVYVEQIGNSNTITIEQSGTRNNYVNYYGNGSFNNVSITQSGTSSTVVNYVDLSVVGNSNNVNIQQLSTGGGKGAFVTIQDNNNNLLLQQKDSGSHYAEVNLTGGNKNVDILQQGSAGHMAKINLSGAAQELSLTQSGNTQQFYSITSNCATAGGCAKITVNQGQ